MGSQTKPGMRSIRDLCYSTRAATRLLYIYIYVYIYIYTIHTIQNSIYIYIHIHTHPIWVQEVWDLVVPSSLQPNNWDHSSVGFLKKSSEYNY